MADQPYFVDQEEISEFELPAAIFSTPSVVSHVRYLEAALDDAVNAPLPLSRTEFEAGRESMQFVPLDASPPQSFKSSASSLSLTEVAANTPTIEGTSEHHDLESLPRLDSFSRTRPMSIIANVELDAELYDIESFPRLESFSRTRASPSLFSRPDTPDSKISPSNVKPPSLPSRLSSAGPSRSLLVENPNCPLGMDESYLDHPTQDLPQNDYPALDSSATSSDFGFQPTLLTMPGSWPDIEDWMDCGSSAEGLDMSSSRKSRRNIEVR